MARRCALLLASLALAACNQSAECKLDKIDCAQHTMKFTQLRDTIFGHGRSDARSCTFSDCHSAAGRKGGLNLETDPHAALVNVPPDANEAAKRKWTPPADWRRVTPGNETTSFMYRKLTMPGPDPMLGDPMPDTGQQLDCDSLKEIACWIRRGAPND